MPIALMAMKLRTLSAHYDFAYLDNRGQVSVVSDVPHDLRRMRSKTGLKRFDRVAEDVAHSNVCRGGVRRSASEALVDRVVLTSIAQSGFDERHVLIPIVFVIEARSRCVGIHDAHLDHRSSPFGDFSDTMRTARQSFSGAGASTGSLYPTSSFAPCSKVRRCIASTKGTSSWYHLLALLRSEYSIVSDFGTRGPP